MNASNDIIERLEGILAEYITMGSKMNIDLTPSDLIRVIDRAIQSAEGGDPEDLGHTDPRANFLQGLYEELLDQPKLILERKHSCDGSTQYKPLSTQVWIDCLMKLRESLTQ